MTFTFKFFLKFYFNLFKVSLYKAFLKFHFLNFFKVCSVCPVSPGQVLRPTLLSSQSGNLTRSAQSASVRSCLKTVDPVSSFVPCALVSPVFLVSSPLYPVAHPPAAAACFERSFVKLLGGSFIFIYYSVYFLKSHLRCAMCCSGKAGL